MTTSTTQRGACRTGMKLRSLVPVLDVHDVDASIEFYSDVLGFTLEDKVEWGGKTEWALLTCDHVQLMLCASQDGDSEDQPPQNGLPDILQPSQGKRDFCLRDPDGYVLWFRHKPAVEDQADEVAQEPQAARPQ